MVPVVRGSNSLSGGYVLSNGSEIFVKIGGMTVFIHQIRRYLGFILYMHAPEPQWIINLPLVTANSDPLDRSVHDRTYPLDKLSVLRTTGP